MLLIVGAALFINSAKEAADSWCSTVYKQVHQLSAYSWCSTVYKQVHQLSAYSWCSTVYKRCRFIVGAQQIHMEGEIVF